MKLIPIAAAVVLSLSVLAPLARATNGSPDATLAAVAQRLLSDPGRDRIYASLTDADSVAVINTKTLAVTATLVVGSSPLGLAISPDGKKLYVVLSGAKKIAVIDLTTLAVLPSLPIAEQGYAIAAGSANRLYVAPNAPDGPILQVNATTGATEAQVGPYQVYGLGFLQISPDHNTLYFGDSGISGSTLYRYDLTTSPPSLVHISNGNTGANGLDLKISHDGQFLCYPNGAGNSMSYQTDVLNPEDIDVIYGRFNVGAYPGPLAFSPDDSVAYEVQVSSGHIFAFSTTSFLRLATLNYTFSGDLSTPNDLATDRNGHYLFFAEGEAVLVYDLLADPAPASATGVINQSFSFQPAIYIAGDASITGALPAGLTFDPLSRTISGTPTESGAYPVVITVTDGVQTVTANVTLDIYPKSRLLNISTRLQVLTGDDVAIAGFIIAGTENENVVVRGLGPSLESDGQPIPGLLENPMIELHDSTGAVIAVNDDYFEDRSSFLLAVVGLTPSSYQEAALYRNLAPGSYTVVLRGVSDGVGVGLIEVYDVDGAINGYGDSRLANISTRGKVETGDDVVIGGFITQGPDDAQIVVRGLGPSLASNGVSSAVLANPALTLYDSQGTKIGFNDDWQDAQATEIEMTGLAPTDPLESAIEISAGPGAYTAILSGVDGGAGVGSVEVYHLP